MSLDPYVHHPDYLKRYLELPSANGEIQAEYVSCGGMEGRGNEEIIYH